MLKLIYYNYLTEVLVCAKVQTQSHVNGCGKYTIISLFQQTLETLNFIYI